jgi:hypothetical protein
MAIAPKFRFTPAFISGLKKAEPGKRYYRWCDSKPHFAIRVTDNGAKSSIVVARRAGQYHPHTHVNGPCAEWTINDDADRPSTQVVHRHPRFFKIPSVTKATDGDRTTSTNCGIDAASAQERMPWVLK